MKSLFASVLLAAPVFAFAGNSIVNGDFEQVDAAGKAVGWSLPPRFKVDRTGGLNGSDGNTVSVATNTHSAVPRTNAFLGGSITEKIAARCKVQMTDEWYGFPRTVFLFQGHQAWVVEPKGTPLAGNPWTWTLQWWSAFVPRTAVPQMLAAGYHHASIDGFEFKGSDEGMKLFADFQEFLVNDLGLAPKARLIGMSWGGFMSTRYAAAYPQNVAKVFLDCPLMNFDGFDAEGPWSKEGKKEGDWSADPRMPVNLAEPIAKAGIPVLLRYGGQDQTVLPRLNCELFIPRFKAAGGDIRVIKNDMYGHQPSGFEIGSETLPEFFR